MLSNNLLGFMLAAIFLGAMATYQLGIFAIFGGFIVACCCMTNSNSCAHGRSASGISSRCFSCRSSSRTRACARNIGSLDSAAAWGWCALTLFLATLGKFGGAYAAARWARLGHYEASLLGVMMNTRALMELIVINVGYDLGVISQQMFTMLVIMAVVSTIVTTPGLSARGCREWDCRCPGGGSH